VGLVEGVTRVAYWTQDFFQECEARFSAASGLIPESIRVGGATRMADPHPPAAAVSLGSTKGEG